MRIVEAATAAISAWMVLGGAPAPPVQEPIFRSRVDAVRVDVLATDRGRPIVGLGAGDFELLDSGVPQKVEAVFAESAALDLFLVFDLSGSVGGLVLDHLKEAAGALLAALRPADGVELVAFSHRVTVPVPLTTDRARVGAAIASLGATGYTSLFDALYVALERRERSPNRSMILVFSDGYDNTSWLGPNEVIDLARETDVVACSVAYKPKVRTGRSTILLTGPDEALLESLAESTGGRLLWAEESADLHRLFLGLLEEMRSRYLLTYYPTAVPSGGWHPITVRLRGRPGKVTARAGYQRR